ncbi:MAG TPA: ATP-binding protein [Acidisarcina sp.]
MAEEQALGTREVVSAYELYPQLLQVPLFAQSKPEDLDCLGNIELVHAPPGTPLIRPGDEEKAFWILLQGQVHAQKLEADGSTTMLTTLSDGETFGEVQLLTGKDNSGVSCEVDLPSTLVRVSDESFWKLMASCAIVRNGIVSNMARRLQAYQAMTLHREKLVSLGTLSAGLMHELNNPGAAARRAASQLRQNLIRLQQCSLRFCTDSMGGEEGACMSRLQEHAMAVKPLHVIDSLEQSDAEERLAEWLESSGVKNSWELAPALTAIGLNEDELGCARSAFSKEELSDALNWLGALTSSMQLVSTIEESITRVTELVSAVKKYSHEDKAQRHQVDVHETLLSTLTILGHKFRQKEVRIEKDFALDLPTLITGGVGLNQVWTNLIDNAIDASPPKGKIRIRTWAEDGKICVAIADQGQGIPEENRRHIFEPFFTTKEVGVGTGLGLDIAHRIVVGNYHGEISFSSEPGATEFVVYLPNQV